MNKKILLSLVMILCVASGNAVAQSGIDIFGFYQVQLYQREGGYSIKGNLPQSLGGAEKTFTESQDDYLSPGVQQLNLMLRKEFSSTITSFVNFEITNNFSTGKDWGEFNLEEVWLNYEYSASHAIKAGYLTPKFNSLNEIKNRMPLLPYIKRPVIYEPSLRSIIDPSDFLPEKAFVQLQGTLDFSSIGIEYAAYAGSSESGYIVSGEKAGSTSTGTDTTSFKLFGGRLGFNISDLRLGVSASFDKDNMQTTIKEDVQRTRVGVELGYSLYGFTLDAELIKVLLDAKNTQKNLDKLFYYVTLVYDLSDKFYAYGTYNYLENNETDFLALGLNTYQFGAGFHASDNVVLKAEYSAYNLSGTMPLIINPSMPAINASANLDIKSYSIAMSVLF